MTTVATVLSIGDLATLTGVSSRTLRYYEERGLLVPTHHTAGGMRQYTQASVGEVERILELKDGLGLSLEEVKTFIESERRLDEIRAVIRSEGTSASPARRAALLEEALALRSAMLERIRTKIGQLRSLEGELEAAVDRVRTLLDDLPAGHRR